jgi:predicted RNA binding protein YcfA (HicA-like mRNA interferase family)
VRYREIERKLRALGCIEVPRSGGGSHRKWRNPATGRATVLPDWAGRDLKPGTVRAAVRQLGLDWERFSQA